MVNSEVRKIFKTRAKVVSFIRSFLDKLDFLEVNPQNLICLSHVGSIPSIVDDVLFLFKVETPMMNRISDFYELVTNTS